MNILVISHMYPNKFNGNSGIFIKKQVEALKMTYGNDINIKVISPIPYAPKVITILSDKYKKYHNNPKKISYDGIDVYYPRVMLLPRNLNFKSSGDIFYKGINGLVKEIYKDFRFDLIHAHVAFPDGECALKLSKEYKKPVITTVHGQDINYTINLNESYKKKVIDVLEKSTSVVFVSNKLKNEALKHTNKLVDFHVIANGINKEDIKQEKSKIVKKELNGDEYILIVGNLIKTKGIDYAIKAFANIENKYPNLKMIIIGDGLEKENLKKLCQEKNIEHKVIFKGRLENTKVMDYMKNCLFFVLPSYKEGFGVVYIEAMAHGKSVIGCKGEGIEDVIENYKDGILVLPKDINDLQKNMELLLTDIKVRNEIELNAKKKVLNNYTWENNADKNLKLYNKVINTK
ncbi:MAG: glycosyltransferase [Clostridium sp.]